MNRDKLQLGATTSQERAIPLISHELMATVDAMKKVRLERIHRDRSKREQEKQEINDDSDFGIDDWLEDIGSRTGAVTVEIGHGYRPWIKDRQLTSNQVYIGLEAEINPHFVKHPLANELNADDPVKEIRQNRRSEKIFFIKSDTGFDPELEEAGLYTNYNPESYLPDEIADQVLVTNVFDDPRLNAERKEKLFKELARLAKPGGKIIIHEDSLVTFSKEEIEKLGLQAKFVAFAELNPSEFDHLFENYGLLGRRFHESTAAEYFLIVEKPINI